MRLKRLSVIAMAVLSCGASVFGQALADRVPADAMIYVGWRGTNDLGPSYAGSRTEAILRESALPALVTETLPEMVKFLEQTEPNAGPAAQAAVKIFQASLKYPTAFYVVADPGGKKLPKATFLIRAGADAPAIAKTINDLVAEANDPKNAPQVVVDKDLLAVLFNYDKGAALPAAGAGSLAESGAFKSAIAHATPDAAYLVYANVAQGIDLLEQQIKPKSPDAEEQRKALKLVEELGLKGVSAFVASGGFAGRDWRTDMFLGSKAPHKGLMAQLQGRPFNAELLKRVPASANYVSAFRFDAAKGLAEVQRATAAVDPKWAQQLKEQIANLSRMTEKDVEKDILEPLGDEWISYAARDIGGTGFFGTVILNKLDDPARTQQTFISLAAAFEEMFSGFTQNSGISLSFRLLKKDDLEVRYLAIPVVAPAWAVKDGYLYLGLYPQSVLAAATYQGKSIDSREEFKATLANLKAGEPVSMTYIDTAATIDDGYNFLHLLLRLYQGLGDMYVANIPEPLLPPLSVLAKESAPIGSATWLDDAGVHTRTVSPFPGAEMLASGSLMTTYTNNAPMMVAILLPSLNRARESANRIKSSSNLRMIGLAMKMHANENPKNFEYPKTLAELIKTQDITADVFDSPLGDAEGGDYVYLYFPGVNDSAPADMMLVYDKAEFDQGEGTNVLFGDGHVEWLTIDRFWEAVKTSREAEPKSAPKAILGQ